VVQYRQHVNVHILPRLRNLKLSNLTIPKVHGFKDDMLATGVSHAMARKVLTSLKRCSGRQGREQQARQEARSRY
jgi:hypothetical protein